MLGGLVWPFSLASYEALCPEGHPVALSNGYTVFAPASWEQNGLCEICKRSVQRTVGMKGMEFVAGPIHWFGVKTEEEKTWFHDVLSAHNCLRCRELGAQELAETLLDVVAKGGKLNEVLHILGKH